MMGSSSLSDRAFRVVYRIGFVAAQCWWFIRRPQHDGALVALWAEDQILLVRQSYQPLWTMPGGGVEPGEAPAAAAAREIGEEIGLVVSDAQLHSAGSIQHFYRWRHDRVHFFEVNVDAKLLCVLDNRELVEFRWLTSAIAHELPLAPHVRDYLLAHSARARPPADRDALAQARGLNGR